MKKIFVLSAIMWLLAFLIPLLFIKPIETDIPPLPVSPSEEKTDVETTDAEIKIKLLDEGKVSEIALDEYLEGVVAAEMPALFPEEALKAQAVAARTYTMKKASSAPAKEHNGAAVCSNPSHCKAYKPLSEFASGWSENAETYSEKIRRAVKETDGEILLYEGEPITAVFHSTSSGRTESSADVWGGNLPYLVSVESEGDETSPHFEEEKMFSPSEFRERFAKKHPDAAFDENPENWITNIRRTAAGGVKSVSVGGVSVKGSELRSIYELKSSNFTVSYDGENMKIKTRGYGHGVGMSQYGARAMAQSGKTYDEILKKYYTGVTLGKVRRKK